MLTLFTVFFSSAQCIPWLQDALGAGRQRSQGDEGAHTWHSLPSQIRQKGRYFFSQFGVGWGGGGVGQFANPLTSIVHFITFNYKIMTRGEFWQ